eukprot:4250951-Prymnesium_polylepis.1
MPRGLRHCDRSSLTQNRENPCHPRLDLVDSLLPRGPCLTNALQPTLRPRQPLHTHLLLVAQPRVHRALQPIVADA